MKTERQESTSAKVCRRVVGAVIALALAVFVFVVVSC